MPCLSRTAPLTALALAGCAPGALAPPTLAPSTSGAVVIATWPAAAAPTRVVVEGAEGPTLATTWRSPGDAVDGVHRAPLLGLWSDAAWTARVEDDAGATSAPVDFETAPLPGTLPPIHVEGQPAWQGHLATSILGGAAAAVVVDEAGEIVWWHLFQRGDRPLRVQPRRDGRGVWVGIERSWPDTGGELVSLGWEGQVLDGWDEPDFSHELVERADGGLAFLTYDRRAVPELGQDATGGALVERDPDGTRRTVWTTWDTWVPGQDGVVHEDGYWTGVNALDHDPDAGTYTVGSRGLDALVELDAATGQVLRQVGGPRSDYSFPEPADAPHNQHQLQWVEGGLLVFDNRGEAEGSRVVELALDEQAGTAWARWSHEADPPIYVFALGDVARAADGSTRITWSTAGQIDHLDPAGALQDRWTLELGYVFGFTWTLDALPGMQRLGG